MSQDPVDEVKDATGAGAMAVPALMALALLFVIVLAALFTALSALFAAPLLMAATYVLDRRALLTFGRAYSSCWLGTFWCLVVIACLLWVLPDRVSAPVAPLLDWLVDTSHTRSARTWVIESDAWRTAALVATPGLAAFALSLALHTGGIYSGAAGFLRALAVGVPVLGVSCPAAYAMLMTAVDRVQSRQIGATDAFSSGFYFAVLTFVGATGAAVIAALALGPWTRWVFRQRGLRWSEALGPVYLGMALYLVTTEAIVFLLPDHHPVLVQARLLAATARIDVWAATLVQADATVLLREIVWIQLPGLIIFASVLSTRLGGVYAGLLGLPRAGAAVVVMLAFTTLTLWGSVAAWDAVRPWFDPARRLA